MGFHKPQLREPVILVIDDNPENLYLLKRTLTQGGYDVQVATNGAIALSCLHHIMPDLILLDIMMPDMNGYEVCQRLKADPSFQDIPIIFITVMDEMADRMKAFSSGGVDYITKPFSIQEVLARVTTQIKTRNLQKELQTRNEQLQQEIRARKRAEEEALRALAKEKELSELKSRFISMASHELRTPLTTIQSTVELLEHYQWTEVERLQRLEQIREAVQHMNHLLEDVLLIGKAAVDKVQPKPEWLDVVQFCQDLLAGIQLTIGKYHHIRFSSQADGLSVWLDPKLLRQILYNLLSNAIKYSAEASRVDVILTQWDQQLLLQVRDEGIGIPPEDQERLFEAFHRATNVEAISGTGLGLTIVKQCVDLQSGQITLESTVGHGTLFTVILPLQKAP
ncbi:hypothetical protein BST81_19980 [Leptolyngbya sp. 'hensonii']|nr:hypothetical protein BST81_19980 [Leptolyngbya sp. 'hensonii']